MPVNAFNGTHNWGYDGVLWYAVHEPYGGPDGLPALRRRLPRRAASASIQDVVYNHLGPSGNYLPMFGPYLQAGQQHRGASRSTSTATGATRCAATSSTTR